MVAVLRFGRTTHNIRSRRFSRAMGYLVVDQQRRSVSPSKLLVRLNRSQQGLSGPLELLTAGTLVKVIQWLLLLLLLLAVTTTSTPAATSAAATFVRTLSLDQIS